ncbi:MAG: hypothetical protein NTV08_00270 [Verrucomicrobia bacterium]|nr:hypothetical protein [Verrucomicrobiota bacterium]
MPTIDGLAGEVDALRQRLKGSAKITSRELRALWNQRLRPFWRLHAEIYRSLARRFLEHGDNCLASEVADEGSQFFGDDVALILIRALATARSGAPQAAQELLARKQGVLADAAEAKSLLARTFKDLWKTSGETRYLEQSFELYHLDYKMTKGDRTFPGVNAASMACFLGRTDDAHRVASDVLSLLRAKPDTANYWDQVTIAECLLVEGQIEPARAAYSAATQSEPIAHAHLATTRAQARLLLRQHGRGESEFDPCFPLPGVLAFTGHRIGAPRFPEEAEAAIRERIREAIVKADAGFGYAAAADGADILFLEAMQAAGLETYVHLPLPEEEFIRQSVAPGWLERYREVTAKATEFTCAPRVGPLAFDYGNRLLLGAACRHAQQLGCGARLLAVWDGRPGNVGGTGDYVRLAHETGCAVGVIDLPGGATNSAPQTEDTTEQLLSVIALSLAAEDEAGSRLAVLLREHEIVQREVLGGKVRLFFRTPAAAAQAVLAIAPHLDGGLGLHTGPVRSGTHPLTGERVMLGDHAAKADGLAALEPAGITYASSAFAALLGLQPLAGVSCEFLGYRALRTGAPREPIFRLRKR